MGMQTMRNKLKSEDTKEELRRVYERCKAEGITSPSDDEMETLMRTHNLSKLEIQTFLGGMRNREKKRQRSRR